MFNNNTLIQFDRVREIEDQEVYEITFSTMPHNMFIDLVEIMKKNGAIFISKNKRWFILEVDMGRLVGDLNEMTNKWNVMERLEEL